MSSLKEIRCEECALCKLENQIKDFPKQNELLDILSVPNIFGNKATISDGKIKIAAQAENDKATDDAIADIILKHGRSEEAVRRRVIDRQVQSGTKIVFDGNRYEVSPAQLQGLVDTKLYSYCTIEYDKWISNGAPSGMPSMFGSYLEGKMKSQPEERHFPYERESDGRPVIKGFAPYAQEDILRKVYFLRKDAKSKASSPYLHGGFLCDEALDKSYSGHLFADMASEEYSHFRLEDYYYYEKSTGVNLALEIAANLEKIKDGDFAEHVLKEAVEPRLELLVQSPSLLSRIALAKNLIKGVCIGVLYDQRGDITLDSAYQMSFAGLREEQKKELQTSIDYACSRWDWYADGLLRTKSSIHLTESATGIAALGERTFEYDNTFEKLACPYIKFNEVSVDKAKSTLQKQLFRITQPINLCEYMKNPIYGPLAFCDQADKATEQIFKKISEKKRESVGRIPRNKSRPFQLFEKVHQDILKIIRQNASKNIANT